MRQPEDSPVSACIGQGQSCHHCSFLYLASFLACLSLGLPEVAKAEWVEWIADTTMQVEYNDNINRSAFSDDEEEDSSLLVSARLGRVNQVTDTFRYSLTADLGVERFDQFEQLHNQRLGASWTGRQKFGLGLTAPWLKARLSYFYLDVRDEERSGDNFELDLQLGKRFSERWDGVVGYRHRDRDGKRGDGARPGYSADVFDQQHNELYLASSYLLSQRLLGAATLTYFRGDMDSSCPDSGVTPVLVSEKANAVMDDRVFGGCVYQLDTDAISLALDLSYALDAHSSLNVGLQHKEAEAETLKYRNNILTASFRYSY